MLGFCDRECRLCFAVALWNGNDRILKERLFGVTGHEGNHAEDVKEHYFYLDATPTHSYSKGLYKYPQAQFPYQRLVDENRIRGRRESEFEIADTGIFDEGRYFDVFVEYAKRAPNDILVRITVVNRGPERAKLHVLPTIWFRNCWSWGPTHESCAVKPRIEQTGPLAVSLSHPTLGAWQAEFEQPGSVLPKLIFTENETNTVKLFGDAGTAGPKKDAFHDFVVEGKRDAVSSTPSGTKVAAVHELELGAGETIVLRARLFAADEPPREPRVFGESFERVFEERIAESDAFYGRIIPKSLDAESHAIARQAYAGLLWNKQHYEYIVEEWLNGDPAMPPPPPQRKSGRNCDWVHLYNRDVIAMPDKWEYPWYAAWDLAFHMIPFAKLDPDFAKQQLMVFLREWYMHPNGQLPAYEWALSDVNPPVHAWACWRVYKMTGPRGARDSRFLASVFQKLLMNFTWWVNRKDVEGRHIFAGGFLGLDNIGLFDRSKPLPNGGTLEQADGTAWMAFYCSTMLSMALELATEQPEYEDIASKFFEHFIAIADAINTLGGSGLWDDADGFYYDKLSVDGNCTPMRIRSIVGIVPLFAVEVLDRELIDSLPGFKKRMNWFLANRKDLARFISYMEPNTPTTNGGRYLLSLPSKEKLQGVLRYVLDETEFLSPYGVRSLSKVHERKPYVFDADGHQLEVRYVPGESESNLFGGNSNWRGPVWFPINYLLVEALERYHHFFGDSFVVECPVGSGRMVTLMEASRELQSRLVALFTAEEDGRRPCHGDDPRFAHDPNWRQLVLFYEYFHGDNGKGLGASHQTGWTSLVTRCLDALAGGEG